MATISTNIKGPAGNKGATGDPGATGPTGPTTLSSNSGNRAQIGTDSKILVPAIPLADPAKNGLVTQVSGLTTDYLTGLNSCADLGAAIKPTIWSVRQRSYNALGNPNMEVRNRRGVFNTASLSGTSVWAVDRWLTWAAGNLAAKVVTQPYDGAVTIPNASGSGTYLISQSYIAAQCVNSTQASLAAGDGCAIYQAVEGCVTRELMGDVTSLTIVATANVVPYSFCVALRDANNAYSWCHTCTITQNATWTVFQIPNIPKFTASGTFNTAPGTVGYSILISPAMGSTFVAPQKDVWVSGNYYGTSDQSNLFTALNNYLDIGFVQHEPGPVCTFPIDIPFDENLRACLRYYAKSTSYSAYLPTGITGNNYKGLGAWINGNAVRMMVDFPVRMAKAPTAAVYGYNIGTVNSIYLDHPSGAGNYGCTGGPSCYDSGMQNITIGTSLPGSQACAALGEWEAQTGW